MKRIFVPTIVIAEMLSYTKLTDEELLKVLFPILKLHLLIFLLLK